MYRKEEKCTGTNAGSLIDLGGLGHKVVHLWLFLFSQWNEVRQSVNHGKKLSKKYEVVGFPGSTEISTAWHGYVFFSNYVLW